MINDDIFSFSLSTEKNNNITGKTRAICCQTSHYRMYSRHKIFGQKKIIKK